MLLPLPAALVALVPASTFLVVFLVDSSVLLALLALFAASAAFAFPALTDAWFASSMLFDLSSDRLSASALRSAKRCVLSAEVSIL